MADFTAERPNSKDGFSFDDDCEIEVGCGRTLKSVLDRVLHFQRQNPKRDLIYFEITGTTAKLYFKTRT